MSSRHQSHSDPDSSDNFDEFQSTRSHDSEDDRSSIRRPPHDRLIDRSGSGRDNYNRGRSLSRTPSPSEGRSRSSPPIYTAESLIDSIPLPQSEPLSGVPVLIHRNRSSDLELSRAHRRYHSQSPRPPLRRSALVPREPSTDRPHRKTGPSAHPRLGRPPLPSSSGSQARDFRSDRSKPPPKPPPKNPIHPKLEDGKDQRHRRHRRHQDDRYRDRDGWSSRYRDDHDRDDRPRHRDDHGRDDHRRNSHQPPEMVASSDETWDLERAGWTRVGMCEGLPVYYDPDSKQYMACDGNYWYPVQVSTQPSPTYSTDEYPSINDGFERDLEFGRGLISELIVDLKTRSGKAATKANLFKWINISSALLIIVLALIVGILTSLSECVNPYIITMSFAIAGIKGVFEVFKLGHRGIHFKYVSIRLRSMLNNINEALFNMTTGQEMVHYATNVRREIDRLDLAMFKSGYGPENIKYGGGGGFAVEHDPDNDGTATGLNSNDPSAPP